jgi:hypothetical protein
MVIRVWLSKFLHKICIKLNPEYLKIFEVKVKDRTPIIYSYRCCGNSTRLADYYIQRLFEVANTRSNIRKITITDHYQGEWPNRPSNSGNEFLFETIFRRIKLEHPNLEGKLKFDLSRKEIRL